MCNFSGQKPEPRDAVDFKDNEALSYPPELTISYMQKVPQLKTSKLRTGTARGTGVGCRAGVRHLHSI